ncbi:MAG: hypothetical protein ACK5XN_34695, partial [Bacteroidota bacterium]
GSGGGWRIPARLVSFAAPVNKCDFGLFCAGLAVLKFDPERPDNNRASAAYRHRLFRADGFGFECGYGFSHFVSEFLNVFHLDFSFLVNLRCSLFAWMSACGTLSRFLILKRLRM